MLTPIEAHYLKIIYKLEEEGWSLVGAQQVAKFLGVTRVTAHEVMMRLVGKEMLRHFPRKGFALTPKGRRLVKRLIRTHRILETMFVKLFNIPLEEACRCATRLELIFSPKIAERIFSAIGAPKCCPHGELIPPLEECDEVKSDTC
ncbi:MAG: metal-dependent transcriptional regulator [Candidatus Njordarchaeales archaeon]